MGPLRRHSRAYPDPTPDPTATPDPTPAPTLRAYVVTFIAGIAAGEQTVALDRSGRPDDDSIAPLRMHAVRAIGRGRRSPPCRCASERRRAGPGARRRGRPVRHRVPDAVGPAADRLGPGVRHRRADRLERIVAVLDTGVDASHPDLDGNIVGGASFVAGSAWDTDPNGHGTAMAGIVAAETDNGTDIAGVGYAGVSVMPVTVLDADGVGRDSDIIEGVVWATDHGADVILMAFSATGYSSALQAAIDYAWAHDVVLVAAAGNDGSSAPAFPAGDRGVIGVANTDQSDSLAAGSNYGDAIFLAAPGVDIVTDPGRRHHGSPARRPPRPTSRARPPCCAANDPAASNGVIVGRLASNADAVGTVARDRQWPTEPRPLAH